MQSYRWLQDIYRKTLFALLDARGVGFVWTPKVLALAERVAVAHLKEQVPDQALRAKLAPTYRMGCKRVLISNDYYPALAQSNTELVTSAIDRVEKNGIGFEDGTFAEVDVIVLSTGFQAAEAMAPFRVVGKQGAVLDEAWQDGAEAYLGTTVSGFPNFFMIVGPNTTLGHNSMVYMIEAQISYIGKALDLLFSRNLQSIEVRPERQKAYNAKIHPVLNRSIWGSGCVSWYRTKHGKNTTGWPGLASQFKAKLRRFDAENYELSE